MKFTVYLMARVPVFSDIEIEAENQAEAFAKADALVAAEGDEITALEWSYGEGASNPIGNLDQRDLYAIEAQDAVPSDEDDEEPTSATHTRTEDFDDLDKAFL
jgi:hypothetical protein